MADLKSPFLPFYKPHPKYHYLYVVIQSLS